MLMVPIALRCQLVTWLGYVPDGEGTAYDQFCQGGHPGFEWQQGEARSAVDSFFVFTFA
jgi:hypothetical protein